MQVEENTESMAFIHRVDYMNLEIITGINQELSIYAAQVLLLKYNHSDLNLRFKSCINDDIQTLDSPLGLST